MNNSKNVTGHVLKGAAILSIAGIITKILSAAYRIPFQNIVGDVGFFIYQQVYPIYGIALILSTYGFPVVISKLIAEFPEEEQLEATRKIGKISFIFLSIVGTLFFIFLFFNAQLIANVMGDEQLTGLIQLSAFSFLSLSTLSVLRGVFQGRNEMVPTAVSQIVEQTFRVGLIIFFSIYLVYNEYNLYYVGKGAILASVIGGMAAIIVLLVFLVKSKQLTNRTSVKKTNISSYTIIQKLLTQGITICISSLLLILINMVDAFTVYRNMVEVGIDETVAKGLKGIYDRGQPFIQLGTVVATAFSLSLVPAITMAIVRKEQKEIEDKINLSLRVSIVIGLGASFGLALLMKPINTMLFMNDHQSSVLMILSFSILFSSIALTGAAILQGLGFPYTPAFIVAIGVGSKYISNILLLPKYDILGAAIATVLSLFIVASIMLVIIYNKTRRPVLNSSFIWTLGKATVFMSVSLLLYLQLPLNLDNREIVRSFLGVIIGGAIFLYTIIRGHYFSKEELLLLPLGKRIARLLN
ncbi:putative polysaccharide biosynthesis protein [Sutcliffiella sp. NC1]|uniref:putative polysaccharide biosynthesis protein n=1 Tax=Sutcliffiella sp. NC1 TaxID=3004096 RepID=UPI0022DD92FB|nr:polysaccharide biosynthesis protein [Sutcliffiella sp. NC1]WBL15190.1 polysaccharide biosynthesis protein [Sutcliffiella sp. NC1]